MFVLQLLFTLFAYYYVKISYLIYVTYYLSKYLGVSL